MQRRWLIEVDENSTLETFVWRQLTLDLFNFFLYFATLLDDADNYFLHMRHQLLVLSWNHTALHCQIWQVPVFLPWNQSHRIHQYRIKPVSVNGMWIPVSMNCHWVPEFMFRNIILPHQLVLISRSWKWTRNMFLTHEAGLLGVGLLVYDVYCADVALALCNQIMLCVSRSLLWSHVNIHCAFYCYD